MKQVYSWVALLQRRPYFAMGVVLAVVLIGWFAFGRNGNGNIETLVVQPAPFVSTVSVSGNVIAAQEVDLGFAQSGRVTGVYANVGNNVTQGTLLAQIENGDLRASLESARAKLAAALEGTRPEEVRVAETAVANDTAALFDAVTDAYRTADDAVRTKTAELFNDPRTNPTLTFITESTRGKRDAESGRLTLEDTLQDWERELTTMTINADLPDAALRAQNVLAGVSAFLAAVSMALNSADTDTITTQDDIDTYIAGITTARANSASAQSALTAAASALDASQKNLALKRAGSTQNDIAIERASVRAAEANLAKTLITAPFSGIITIMDAKVGKIISPNTPEISMMNIDTFQIESYVPEVNIASVKVNDPATITLDAYGAASTFNAHVISVDPAETVRDGVSTYRTILQFDVQDERVKSGMTANVYITTDTREQVLAVPRGIIILRDGKKFVRVQVGKNFEDREVTTGAVSNLGNIEILSGLNPNEVVVLQNAQ
ncbi:MAG: HlyD family efflux transporter periplasmic adaptor subunit [Patescibacteria group bacterium]